MDLYCFEHSMPASHYEIAAKAYSPSRVAKLKSKAFLAMDELHGWCTKEKAATLMDLVLMLRPTTVVEIGVFGGKSLVPIAYALQEGGEGKIYGIDPWSSAESIVGMDAANREYWSNINHEDVYQGLLKKISKFGLQDYISLIRCTSEAASPISNIDILHIDGNPSEENSLQDVMKWFPFVRSGGLIIVNDIYWGAKQPAIFWLDQNCIEFTTFPGDNIWGIWIKP